MDDDDDLRDDIEDKNASFSDYSFAKNASTQNSSRSATSSNSGGSSSQKKRKKKKSVFKQLISRFWRGKKPQEEVKEQEDYGNFDEQIKRIREESKGN